MTKEAKVSDFIQKLYSIMESDDKYSKVICWSDQQILVKDVQTLVRDILPQFYRHSKMESFVRQLNLYGFKKVSKPYIKDCLYFKHENFKPGHSELLHRVQLKSKEKCQQLTNGRANRKDDLRALTQRREDELNRMRSSFKATVQRLFNQISQINEDNPSLQGFFKNSLVLLQLSGAQDDRQNIRIRESHSITQFFTKVDLE